jgi:hypothetical protein
MRPLLDSRCRNAAQLRTPRSLGNDSIRRYPAIQFVILASRRPACFRYLRHLVSRLLERGDRTLNRHIVHREQRAYKILGLAIFKGYKPLTPFQGSPTHVILRNEPRQETIAVAF